jgi:hypothetical protein
MDTRTLDSLNLIQPPSPITLVEHADREVKLVTQFREILLWPVQLMPLREGLQIHHHWELLRGSR